MNDTAIFASNIPGLKLLNRGKVRDIYDLDADRLLILTTDRLSAFDVILPQPIPGKGEILTRLSNFWFARLAAVVPNHLTGTDPLTVLPDDPERPALAARALIVRKLRPLPIEAIVRGYLIGSGWKDYQKTGAICGIALPAGLRQAQQLPEPIFTPSTKADQGDHDENIDFDQVVARIGADLAGQVRDVSLRLYREAAHYARERGIIIADTKFEFGLDPSGRLHLIDEVLTPDSSRFWPVADYREGTSPPSFDKQYVRDYLETLDWDKHPPAPRLPEAVITRTAAKYLEAQTLLGA